MLVVRYDLIFLVVIDCWRSDVECERYLDLKTAGFLLILFWILAWGFGDEVKIACFLVFGDNKTTSPSFPST